MDHQEAIREHQDLVQRISVEVLVHQVFLRAEHLGQVVKVGQGIIRCFWVKWKRSSGANGSSGSSGCFNSGTSGQVEHLGQVEVLSGVSGSSGSSGLTGILGQWIIRIDRCFWIMIIIRINRIKWKCRFKWC
jgi:hypothetical protein